MKSLRGAGFQITPYCDLFSNPSEPDPWILYHCGTLGLIVISADDRIRKTWTHVEAARAGKTAVFCLTSGKPLPVEQAAALIQAKPAILRVVSSRTPPYFVSVSKAGKLRTMEEMPDPRYRKNEVSTDWQSYLRVLEHHKRSQRLAAQADGLSGNRDDRAG